MWTIIQTEISKLKRKRMTLGIFALTTLLAIFAIECACSISRSRVAIWTALGIYIRWLSKILALFSPHCVGKKLSAPCNYFPGPSHGDSSIGKRTMRLQLFIPYGVQLSTGGQKVVEQSNAPDEETLIQSATEYFEQMRSGDFENLYNASLEDSEPGVSCYRPEHSEQIRVELVIPCENENFKVFINYDNSGNLCNYVVWKNS